MNTKFDLNKCEKDSNGHWLCQTNDGRPVRVLCNDRRDNEGFYLVALIQGPPDIEVVQYFPETGASKISSIELRNTPRKVKRWVNVPPNPSNGCWLLPYESKHEAAVAKGADQTTIEIEWEEI